MPFCSPKQVLRNEAGHIHAMEFYKTELDDNGKLVIDKDQFVRIKVDFVISAFGSETVDSLRKVHHIHHTRIVVLLSTNECTTIGCSAADVHRVGLGRRRSRQESGQGRRLGLCRRRSDRQRHHR
jgi:NADPH-dependent glutamate synthase beta subunit-like oxidoreductase